MFRFPNLLQLELKKLKCSSAVSMDLYESLWLKSIYVICETQIIWKNIWVLRLLQVREDTQTRMITSDETFAWILSYLLHSLITDGYWSYHNMPPLTSSPGCTFWSLSVILSLSFNSAFLSLCLLWLLWTLIGELLVLINSVLFEIRQRAHIWGHHAECLG